VRRRDLASGEDLVVLPADDTADADRTTASLPSRLPWARLGAGALAAIATCSLVSIAWEQRDQDRLARQQACITNAQMAATNESQGAMAVAIARCLKDPAAVLAATEVIVPGVVSMRLGQATTVLTQDGLESRLVTGPATPDAFIIDQQPRIGVSVPAGTVVEVTTRSP